MKKIKDFFKYLWSLISGNTIKSGLKKDSLDDGPGGPLPTDPKGGGNR